MNDPLLFIIDSIQYDYLEDDDEVQGNWAIQRDGETVTVRYDPFPDSPHPPVTRKYRVTPID